MAFSTQKDFFNVPFLTESYELGCKKACVKLKSYESTEDTRAWASDKAKQSKFLSDLVTCEYPIGEGEGDSRSTDPQLALTGSENADVDFKAKKTSASDVEIMTGGDSLLQCANVHLAEYQKLLKINTILEKQLDVSNEQLKTAKQENAKIVEIVANKLDSNTAKDFYNKIQKFTTAGKFNRNEENEMLQIYQKMKNMNEFCQVLQAENNYLKRLIEKLKRCVQLENITIQPEQSQDIGYLQREVNSLRKECLMLRHIEEDYQKSKQQKPKTLPGISEQDAENIKVIIKERNSLREKCKTFNALEKQVEQLEHETHAAKKEANDLNSSLSSKMEYISTIESEMQNMQKFYEKKAQESCLREECLKAQLEDLKDEFMKTKCEAYRAQKLTMEISCLRNELEKRNYALNEYDCQYQELMEVVKELKSVKLQDLHDSQTQTCKEQADELTFYTCATLEEILKELKHRGCLDNELVRVHADADSIDKDGNEVHCCAEVERLKQQLNELKKRMREEANCEEICKDALERLKEFETENSQLLHDNQDLKAKLIESENKLAKMLTKLEKLNEDIDKNGLETISIGKGLEENIALVKNISDVQLKNQQLANAVSAINSRDDQKIIDDLRRQLDKELAKLRKCQLDNAHLLEEVKQREMGLKELKELNNKLMADNDKLKSNVHSTPAQSAAKKSDKTDIPDNDKLKSNVHSTPAQSAAKKSDKTDIPDNDKLKSNVHSTPAQSAAKKSDKTDIPDNDKLKSNVHSTPAQSAAKKSDKTDIPKYKEKRTSNYKVGSKASQKVTDIKDTSLKQAISVEPQKITDFTDSDGFATSSASKETTRKQYKASPLKDRDVLAKQHEQRNDLVLDGFVNKKTDSFKISLQKGHSFGKEFRKILEEFICECSNYFCDLFNAKSKLYIICHKLCHNGIDALNFQELAYIHRRIYNQADKLLPGCMLDMILTEHREQVESILTSVIMPRLIQSKKLSFTGSDGNACNDDQKCCCCKNELCCNNSEEMLKDKVSKLEKDIDIAREYLESLKSIPLDDSLTTDNDNSTDTNNSTYRASSATSKLHRLSYTKHVKKLKARPKQ